MTKDVLVSISGLHFDTAIGEGPDNEPIEIITPGQYYLKNGKHYVLYEEPVEGMIGTVKNTIKISGEHMLEIIKSGLSNTHMVFEKDRIHMTRYETPYGELLVGIHTKKLKAEEKDDLIELHVQYALDVNGEKVADCNINLKIKSLAQN